MLLSSNVIKRVASDLENHSVYPRIGLRVEEEKKPMPDQLEIVKKEANNILINARSQAASLLEETKNKIITIEQETYTKGHEKGEQDALLARNEAQAKFRASTSKILKELEEIRENIYRDTEEEIVKLAVAIAEKIVGRQLDLNPATILDIAMAACSQAKDCKQVIIYVAPEHVEIMRASQDSLAAQLYKTNRLTIISDINIKSGGCRVETEQGCIDATVTTMFKQLEAVTKGILN
jgi:flagellar assembly protein FliH